MQGSVAPRPRRPWRRRGIELLRRLLQRGAILILAVLPVTACGALPKIVVLHDPLSPQEHLRLGERYEAEGKIPLALSEYESALKGGDRPDVLSHLGNAYQLEGDSRRAESFFLRSLKEKEDQPLVLNNLAAVYALERAHLDRAQEFVEKALRLDPEHRPYYLETLSEIYLAQGRPQEALQALADAERSAPPDPLLQRSLNLQRTRIEGLSCKPQCPKETGLYNPSDDPSAPGRGSP